MSNRAVQADMMAQVRLAARRTIAVSSNMLPLGRVVATPGALAALTAAETDPTTYLARHASGDWGEIDEHDRAVNEHAVDHGERGMSVYHLRTGKIWIVTE